jgi:hypothetical protein
MFMYINLCSNAQRQGGRQAGRQAGIKEEQHVISEVVGKREFCLKQLKISTVRRCESKLQLTSLGR